MHNFLHPFATVSPCPNPDRNKPLCNGNADFKLPACYPSSHLALAHLLHFSKAQPHTVNLHTQKVSLQHKNTSWIYTLYIFVQALNSVGVFIKLHSALLKPLCSRKRSNKRSVWVMLALGDGRNWQTQQIAKLSVNNGPVLYTELKKLAPLQLEQFAPSHWHPGTAPPRLHSDQVFWGLPRSKQPTSLSWLPRWDAVDPGKVTGNGKLFNWRC